MRKTQTNKTTTRASLALSDQVLITDTPLKVVAYCRVSTDNQKEEGTINLQVDAIREYCQKKGFDLVYIFKDDGISGGLEDRPALASLFNFLEGEEGYQTKRGGSWYASTVSYILKNPIYKGFYEYKGIESQREDLALLQA